MEILGSAFCCVVPFIWLSFALITAAIESSKGRSGALGFLLGLLLGPFGIVISAVQPAEFRVCPYCKEKVKPDAQVCWHCGKSFLASANSKPA